MTLTSDNHNYRLTTSRAYNIANNCSCPSTIVWPEMVYLWRHLKLHYVYIFFWKPKIGTMKRSNLCLHDYFFDIFSKVIVNLLFSAYVCWYVLLCFTPSYRILISFQKRSTWLLDLCSIIFFFWNRKLEPWKLRIYGSMITFFSNFAIFYIIITYIWYVRQLIYWHSYFINKIIHAAKSYTFL